MSKRKTLPVIPSFVPEKDLMEALLLFREFRIKTVKMSLNPSAGRIAIKLLALMDDYFAQQNITAEQEKEINAFVTAYFNGLIKEQEQQVTGKVKKIIHDAQQGLGNKKSFMTHEGTPL